MLPALLILHPPTHSVLARLGSERNISNSSKKEPNANFISVEFTLQKNTLNNGPQFEK